MQEPQGGGAHGPSEDAEIARFVTPLETPEEAKERKRGASRGHLTGVEGPRRLNPGPRCPPVGLPAASQPRERAEMGPR